jgi:hypothetical protein
MMGGFGNPERPVVIAESLIAAQADRVREQTEFDGMGYPIDESSVRRGALMEILEAVFVQGQNDFMPIAGTASVSVGDVIRIPDSLPQRLDLFTVAHWVVTPNGFKPLTNQDLVEYQKLAVDDRTWSKFVRPEFAAKQAAKKAEAQKPKEGERQIMVDGFDGNLVAINILSTPVAGFPVNAKTKSRWAAYGEAMVRNTAAGFTDAAVEARAIAFRNNHLVVTVAEIKRLEAAGHSFVVLEKTDEHTTGRAILITTPINA